MSFILLLLRRFSPCFTLFARTAVLTGSSVPFDAVGPDRTDLWNVIECDVCDATFDYDDEVIVFTERAVQNRLNPVQTAALNGRRLALSLENSLSWNGSHPEFRPSLTEYARLTLPAYTRISVGWYALAAIAPKLLEQLFFLHRPFDFVHERLAVRGLAHPLSLPWST